ncbi:MAG: hypothetical protein GX662_12580 [Trichococcus flocculiformis]|uniref:Uncharacterized protein n=1 Tax=Trichococcus flocculiformis TaxID=82803 RepID=A0A847D8U5_9LACT|nr:hypothetical protein [Trichococcus flocculiformis]NLD33068.1 hypothetical protein [Trichococcus flocculiformis]
MTNEYLEELLRFVGKLCPKFIEGEYNESDYDRRINLIYRKYLKEVGRASMQHLNIEQLKELNRRCREETE